MRVLYVSRSLSVHDQRFLSKIRAWGVDTVFAALTQGGDNGAPSAAPQGVRWLDWLPRGSDVTSPRRATLAVEHFAQVLKTEAPDLVHAGPLQTGAYLAALAGARPLIAMSWGSDVLADAKRDGEWRSATRTALLAADRVLCDCETVRAAVAAYGVPDQAIVQFPWGTDLRAFAPGPDRLGLRRVFPADALVVISIRAWEPGYDIELVVQAFALAREHDERLRLILVGGGSMEEAVQEKIGWLGLKEFVATPGVIPPDLLSSYLRAADIYLSCAPQDGSSVSLLEAMASGLPVVVADNPSNREWVGEGGGALAARGQSDSFATGLLLLAAKSEVERRGVGRRNRDVVERRADWERNVAQLRLAYEALLRGSAAPQ